MARSIWQQYIQQASGRPRAGAIITVTETETGDPADIYTAEEGGSPVASVTSSATGRAFFWVEPGIYDITATYAAEEAVQESVEIGPVIRGDGEQATQLVALAADTFISAPIFKTKSGPVDVDAGDYALDLDTFTVFRVNVTESGTVTFTNTDAAAVYSFLIVATTTGAFGFTSLTFPGVTIYKRADSTISLKASGRTLLGCTFDAAAMTLDVVVQEMEGV